MKRRANRNSRAQIRCGGGRHQRTCTIPLFLAVEVARSLARHPCSGQPLRQVVVGQCCCKARSAPVVGRQLARKRHGLAGVPDHRCRRGRGRRQRRQQHDRGGDLTASTLWRPTRTRRPWRRRSPHRIRLGAADGRARRRRAPRSAAAAMARRSSAGEQLRGRSMSSSRPGWAAAPAPARRRNRACRQGSGPAHRRRRLAPVRLRGLAETLARQGLELRPEVDTLIVVPNQKLLTVASPDTTFATAFRMADGVLLRAVRAITDLILTPGLVNLDFADVCTVGCATADARPQPRPAPTLAAPPRPLSHPQYPHPPPGPSPLPCVSSDARPASPSSAWARRRARGARRWRWSRRSPTRCSSRPTSRRRPACSPPSAAART